MSHETELALQKSLDAFDSFRRRMHLAGWVTVVATLGMYGRLAYLHRTTDNLETLLGASVAALTCLIAWATFAIVIATTRIINRVLRAVDLLSRTR